MVKASNNNLPDGWLRSRLGDIVIFLNGKGHEKNIASEGQYVVINSKFISSDGNVRKYTDECLAPLQIGQVAMVMSDVPNGRAIAKCFQVKENNKYTLNQRIGAFSSKKIVPSFLYYLLNRNRYFLSFDDGVNQTNLRKEDILECPLTYPPADEQRRVVKILETWDLFLEKLERKIEIKKNIKKGLMQQLLTGKRRLREFNGKWKNVQLGDCLKIRHGKPQKEVEAINGQYPILGTGGEFGRANKCLYDRPSVLIGRKGTIDRPFYMDKPFWTVDTLFYSEVKDGISAKFIYYCFLMINWKKYNEGSGVPSLSASTISSINFSIPPDIKEQRGIADVLTKADEEIDILEKKKNILESQKIFLLNSLVTGKIRTPETIKV